MKVTVNNNQVPKEKSFPRLMTDRYKIVLFSDPSNAVVVGFIDESKSIIKLGERIYPSINQYVDFEGSITLSND